VFGASRRRPPYDIEEPARPRFACRIRTIGVLPKARQVPTVREPRVESSDHPRPFNQPGERLDRGVAEYHHLAMMIMRMMMPTAMRHSSVDAHTPLIVQSHWASRLAGPMLTDLFAAVSPPAARIS